MYLHVDMCSVWVCTVVYRFDVMLPCSYLVSCSQTTSSPPFYMLTDDVSLYIKIEGRKRSSCARLIPYGRKFWRGIYFGGLAVLRAIRQYFIRQKLHNVMSSLLRNHSLCTSGSYIRQSNRRHGVYHWKLRTRTSLLQRVLYTEGEELACLSTRRRRFKRRVHGRCKDRRDENSSD